MESKLKLLFRGAIDYDLYPEPVNNQIIGLTRAEAQYFFDLAGLMSEYRMGGAYQPISKVRVYIFELDHGYRKYAMSDVKDHPLAQAVWSSDENEVIDAVYEIFGADVREKHPPKMGDNETLMWVPVIHTFTMLWDHHE